jgi:hypothetical protein
LREKEKGLECQTPYYFFCLKYKLRVPPEDHEGKQNKNRNPEAMITKPD